MSRDRQTDEPSQTGEHLPAENGPREIETLEPHQQTIERVAHLYFEGCRQVARAVAAIKDRMSDDRE